MFPAICCVATMWLCGATGCSDSSASHPKSDGGVVGDTGSIDQAGDHSSAALDADDYPLPSGAGQGGFVTWTYHGQPVGLYLPVPTDKPVPIVMFLHGCGNDPVVSNWWIIAALNQIEPCAVLLPFRPKDESPTCSAWGGTYDEDLRASMIDALAGLDRVVAEYGLDDKRQYLYGESMGAEGVLKLLVEFPARFAGAVSVAGYTLDTGAQQMAKTPLWLIQGGGDTVNKPESITTIYQSIVNAGGSLVKLTEYPDLEHNPSILRARSESCVLDWLLAQRHDGIARPGQGSCDTPDGGASAGNFRLDVKGFDAAYEGKPVRVALLPGAVNCAPSASAPTYSGEGAVVAGACTLSIPSVPNGPYTACGFVDVDGNSMAGPGDLASQIFVVVSGDTKASSAAVDWSSI